MHWAICAILAAVMWATADLLSKIAMERMGYREKITLLARFLHSLPLLGIAVVTTKHKVDPLFWLYCLLVIPGDVVASNLYIKALKISPISVVVPFMSFAPVFMLLSSTIMLAEPPSITGITGVLLVTIGAYTINLHKFSEGPLEPLKAIFDQKGPLMVIIAAAIFSIDTAWGKKATRLSDAFFFSFWYCLFMAIAYLPLTVKEEKRIKPLITSIGSPILWGIGACFGTGVICFLKAINMANIAYVSAVGKTSMFLAIIYGKLFFNEENLKNRLLGVLFMFVGIYLIFID